jgi:hypothetical protein
VLYVGLRNRRTRAVRERQANGALKRQWFRLAEGCDRQYSRKYGEQIGAAQTRQSEFHLVPFISSLHPVTSA